MKDKWVTSAYMADREIRYLSAIAVYMLFRDMIEYCGLDLTKDKQIGTIYPDRNCVRLGVKYIVRYVIVQS